jgi:hypothetical protein
VSFSGWSSELTTSTALMPAWNGIRGHVTFVFPELFGFVLPKSHLVYRIKFLKFVQGSNAPAQCVAAHTEGRVEDGPGSLGHSATPVSHPRSSNRTCRSPASGSHIVGHTEKKLEPHGTFSTTSGTGVDANLGTIAVHNGGTFEVGGTLNNSGTTALSGGSATLGITGDVTLTGGGKVTLSPSNKDNIIGASSSGATLTNVNNTIVGFGFIGTDDNNLTLINSGTIDGNIASGYIAIQTGSNMVTNAGTLEATGRGILYLDSNVANPGKIAALGTGAGLRIQSATVSNTGSGLILASGTGEEVVLEGGTILGGTLKTSGVNALFAAFSAGNVISGATIASGSVVKAISGGTLTADDVTLQSKALVAAVSGGTLTLSGGTIGAGAMVETMSGGSRAARKAWCRSQAAPSSAAAASRSATALSRFNRAAPPTSTSWPRVAAGLFLTAPAASMRAARCPVSASGRRPTTITPNISPSPTSVQGRHSATRPSVPLTPAVRSRCRVGAFRRRSFWLARIRLRISRATHSMAPSRSPTLAWSMAAV